eukprot:GHRR01024207.1.p1 GENE.GHRR01024207.1~~GHRR01024207.1.p1  ORF type:complete len:307 (+),score=94.57 GHRR01024207.1:298-1218(+)
MIGWTMQRASSFRRMPVVQSLISRRATLVGALSLAVVTAVSLGAGSAKPRQPQQQQHPQQQKQQEVHMGTLGKLMGGVRTSQDELVDYLIRSKLVKTARVAEAMRQVDRGKYINPAFATMADAYQDRPLAIGEGQTISAPHMHAVCLELLEPFLQPGARVLDVGSGSGYLSACMAKLLSPDGHVLGVEKVPELVVHANNALQAGNPELLPADGGKELLRIVHGNVLSDLLADEAPFQAIHVGAAADELHQVLLDKLAPGGRMVIPVGPRYSYQVCSLPCPPSPAALLIKFSRCSCAQWQCTMLHNQ